MALPFMKTICGVQDPHTQPEPESKFACITGFPLPYWLAFHKSDSVIVMFWPTELSACMLCVAAPLDVATVVPCTVAASLPVSESE